jgi:hypothetical protein
VTWPAFGTPCGVDATIGGRSKVYLYSIDDL